jgi:predicted ArsR family transcriptional regulator
LLRQRHEATIEELTRELELAPATVRRHLDVLQRDGQVATRAVRRPTGRPHFVFTLTPEGLDVAPAHYIRVTSRLVQEIVRLSPEHTRGKSGYDVARLVFDSVMENLARQCRSRITATSLEDRLEQALARLADEGLVFEVAVLDGALVMRGEGCPCRRVIAAENEACNHDQALLSAILDADVVPAHAVQADEPRTYLVRERKVGVL